MDNFLINTDIPNSQYQFEVRSYIGGREEQQDFAGLFSEEDYFVAVVCDGMGGEQSGRLASETGVRVTLQRAAQFRCEENVPEFLQRILIAANKEVFSLLSGKGGSTMVIAFRHRGELYWASAGDSRLYIWRAGELMQVTRDHNYHLLLGEMLKEGELSPEKFEAEANKGTALISFIGLRKLNLYDLTEVGFELHPDDVLLLTTDGLINAVPLNKIENILAADFNLEKKATLLGNQINQELETEGQDNSTFILIKVL